MATRSVLILAIAGACAGHYGGKPAAPGPDTQGIEAAGLPYQILDARTGHEVVETAFWTKLATERAVCVGEEHRNPHHHWFQLQVVQHLARVWPHGALGMEMFQRPFQGVLDDYATHRIDATALLSRSGWEDRWGFDFGMYRPIMAAAIDAHQPVLALNAAKELTKKVAHKGIEGLASDERAQLPQLELHDAAHRAWFDALMEDMGGASAHGQKSEEGEPDDKPTAERVYSVQVIWDETMADTAAKWLASHADGRLVILAGTGHCHDSAIVGRLKRRGVKEVVSLRTVIDDGEGGLAEALAKPINDYLVVLQMPPGVKHAGSGDH